jgi:cobalamin biosynthesis Mg chelatase CobN
MLPRLIRAAVMAAIALAVLAGPASGQNFKAGQKCDIAKEKQYEAAGFFCARTSSGFQLFAKNGSSSGSGSSSNSSSSSSSSSSNDGASSSSTSSPSSGSSGSSSSSGSETTSSNGALARTGFDLWPLIGIGVACLGACALALRRRARA